MLLSRRVLAAAAAIAVPVALAACSDDSDSPKAPAHTCSSPSGMSQDDWLRLCGPGTGGDSGPQYTAPVGGWVVMPNGIVLSVSRVEAAPATETAAPGATLALVTLTVTNRTTAPYDASGIAIREMGRVDGTRAERVTHSALPDQNLPNAVPPGQTAFAQQLFNVPDALRPGFRIIVAMTPVPSALPDATFTGTLPATAPGGTPATTTSP
ncbi:hypothetical protein OG216_45440 [Streptomycetaceae bacterium NBC_01309]